MTEEWYSEIGRAYSFLPDYDAAYALLRRLYLRIIDESVCDSKALLAGSFAKTDYLLKEKSASPELRRMVNAMRVRLTGNKSTWRPEDFLQDFKSLCLFVSLLYGAPIPDSLLGTFSSECCAEQKQLLIADCVRAIVDSWDEEFVYCIVEQDGGLFPVRYSGQGQLFAHDHSYLGEFFKEGMMLNIIRPRKDEDGVLLPEFFIVEPDYLVDVSAIASCFETYAESPQVSVLNRFAPSVVTEPILIGNMAGELLDTIIHEREGRGWSLAEQRESYSKSVKKFFRSNAVGVISVAPGTDFHKQAWQQMLNIHAAVNVALPNLVGRYDRDKIVVEPTFFSEMLGLQGRMDMLQTDMRVLVEQKSGKAAFIPHDTDLDVPKYKEQHYIQMLLYMAIIKYNYRDIYEENNQELHSFLLYSQYTCSLVGLGSAPRLLFKALKIRNLYVLQENYLRSGGIEDFMTQTPEDFNEKHVGGILWQRYQRPRIEFMLSCYQEASELERAYFLRFYRFVALEHALSKLGCQAKECSGFASAWLSSLEEKQQCGNIILNMDLHVSSLVDSDEIEQLSFIYDGESGNFRQGDAVVLYPYVVGNAPDLRMTIVYRALISKIEPDEITLRLKHPQKNVTAFCTSGNVKWCIEHDFMESSYNGLYKGLHSFLSTPKERRDLVLMQRKPEVVENVPLSGDYGCFDELQQKIKNAKELFLVIGPPGTGKTSFGMLNTLQEELHEEGSKILIVSYTNRAVDEICSKLYPSIDFIRLGSAACASEMYQDRYLANIVAECASSADLAGKIANARVLVGTISSITLHLPLVAMSRFSLCIVDEASQILEPHLLPLLSLCCSDGLPCVSKFVMIGDHKQLPAVVQQRTMESRVDEPALIDVCLTNCRNSMFERFLARYATDAKLCHMLTCQGRMHRDIANFPNVAFYDGKLCEVPLAHQHSPSLSARVRFVDVPSPSESVSDKVNLAEASVIADELLRIWKEEQMAFNPLETVGVIVPYRSQISAIRTILSDRLHQPLHPLMQITIDTVERFQGSQRKHIIYGLTVQKHYQLRFLAETTFEEHGKQIDRKLNVAMTRAQEYLIIVGNASLLSRVPVYESLIRYVGIKRN